MRRSRQVLLFPSSLTSILYRDTRDKTAPLLSFARRVRPLLLSWWHAALSSFLFSSRRHQPMHSDPLNHPSNSLCFNQQQVVSTMLHIIDGDSPVVIVPQSPRRSFLFSAAAAVTGCTVSWQYNPLIANAAATDCFADCLKNCKLIAPKVRSWKVSHLAGTHTWFLTHPYFDIECLKGSELLSRYMQGVLWSAR